MLSYQLLRLLVIDLGSAFPAEDQYILLILPSQELKVEGRT